jgi:hypothetical protein
MPTEPFAPTVTGKLNVVEELVPNVKVTEREVTVFTATPCAFTVTVHGSTLKVLPAPKELAAGNVVLVMVKMQEPNDIVPLAVEVPLVAVNAGAALVPLNATVVEPVMEAGAPAASTPLNPLGNTATGAAAPVCGSKAPTTVLHWCYGSWITAAAGKQSAGQACKKHTLQCYKKTNGGDQVRARGDQTRPPTT